MQYKVQALKLNISYPIIYVGDTKWLKYAKLFNVRSRLPLLRQKKNQIRQVAHINQDNVCS